MNNYLLASRQYCVSEAHLSGWFLCLILKLSEQSGNKYIKVIKFLRDEINEIWKYLLGRKMKNLASTIIFLQFL